MLRERLRLRHIRPFDLDGEGYHFRRAPWSPGDGDDHVHPSPDVCERTSEADL